MLGWIVGVIAVAAMAIVTANLLGNDEIFDQDMEYGAGTGGAFPYGRIESLSCDTKVQFTESDKKRAAFVAREVRDLLGEDPAGRICRMGARARIAIAYELHRRLCTGFLMDLGLEMKELENECCGFYYGCEKVICINYRYLLSNSIDCIRMYLNTMIHEFRHAMQYHFIEDRMYNGAEESYCRRMAISIHPSVYMEFSESPELYQKQLCERDAKAYSEMVMQLVKGGKEGVWANEAEDYL